MFYFFEQTNELLVLKQWKAAFYRSISPLLGWLRKKYLVPCDRSSFLRTPRSSGVFLYIMVVGLSGVQFGL